MKNIHKITLIIFIIIGLLIVLFVFANNKKKENVSNQGINSEMANKNTQSLGRYCYLNKTSTPPEFGDEYNYHFISFEMSEDYKITDGIILSYPYATDSQRGSFSGLFDPETHELKTIGVTWGEGMRWESKNTYALTDTGLQFVFEGNPNPDYELPRVDCGNYDKERSIFETRQLSYLVNTIDRARLAMLPVIQEQNLTEDELNDVQFVERALDLDNNFETEEYLIYPYGPYYCGSGGCNLYIVDDNNDIISETSVTKLPIYTELVDFENNPPQKGVWEDIIVWSDGAYRRLSHDGTGYPSNPSLEPGVTVEEVELHPEMYFKLLDYIN